ncbi:MAG: polysaccharide deacetylase family protein [Firmicutes bacterium]|nr:polysaccharide deacetylase family protein [Bacillota bacterium]
MDRSLRSAALLVALALAALAAAAPAAAWLRGPGAELEPRRAGPAAGAEIALTFDIAWGEHAPGDVLRALAAQDTPATFFVSGPWALAHPEEARAIRAAGHALGTLGEGGRRLSRVSVARLKAELERAASAVETASGTRPAWFRPPDGDYDTDVVRAAREAGLETVTWTVDARDEGAADPQSVARRVLRAARPGAIVRLHADDGAPATADAIAPIVQGLRAAGYRLVTLSAWPRR